jgi:hypothetical protein
MRIAVFRVGVAAVLLTIGYMAGRIDSAVPVVQAAAQTGRVFELRTYTTNDGKMPALQARFRDHTIKFFDKYNMKSIGYWTPMDGPTAQNTLIYIIAHESRDAAKASWASFNADPDWVKVRNDSQAAGTILAKPPDSVFLTPTDYSPLK